MIRNNLHKRHLQTQSVKPEVPHTNIKDQQTRAKTETIRKHPQSKEVRQNLKTNNENQNLCNTNLSKSNA